MASTTKAQDAKLATAAMRAARVFGPDHAFVLTRDRSLLTPVLVCGVCGQVRRAHSTGAVVYDRPRS